MCAAAGLRSGELPGSGSVFESRTNRQLGLRIGYRRVGRCAENAELKDAVQPYHLLGLLIVRERHGAANECEAQEHHGS